MSKSPRTHTAAFKAQVALAAMKGDQTLSQVAARFGVHTRLVQGWKKQLLDQAATIFSGTTHASDLKKSEEENAELFEQIGRLKMELEWLKKKFPTSAEWKRQKLDRDHPTLSIRRQC